MPYFIQSRRLFLHKRFQRILNDSKVELESNLMTFLKVFKAGNLPF